MNIWVVAATSAADGRIFYWRSDAGVTEDSALATLLSGDEAIAKAAQLNAADLGAEFRVVRLPGSSNA